MSLLALIRHGPTDWSQQRRLQGRADLPLSEAGRMAVARWRVPDSFGVALWLSSPLRRCVETAALLRGDSSFAVEPRLIEMDYGAWEGKTLTELRADPAVDAAAREDLGVDFRAPGGESPREVQARLRPLLLAWGADRKDRVAVTHKGVIRALYAQATGWPMMGKPPHRLHDACLHLFALAGDGAPSLVQLNVPLTEAEPSGTTA